NLMDHPRECYGTHDAGGLQGFHCPQLRGTVPEGTPLQGESATPCILVGCPKRGDGQDRAGSHLLELLPKCDTLIAGHPADRPPAACLGACGSARARTEARGNRANPAALTATFFDLMDVRLAIADSHCGTVMSSSTWPSGSRK